MLAAVSSVSGLDLTKQLELLLSLSLVTDINSILSYLAQGGDVTQLASIATKIQAHDTNLSASLASMIAKLTDIEAKIPTNNLILGDCATKDVTDLRAIFDLVYTLANLGGVPLTRTVGLVDLSADRTLADIGAASRRVVKISDFTADVFGRYVTIGGTIGTPLQITDPASASTNDVYEIVANSGYIQFNGTGQIYHANACAMIRRYDGASWSILTYERHIQIPAKLDGSVGSQPTTIDFFTAGGLQYSNVGTKNAFCQFEVPDDWDGGDMYFEVDWMPDGGATTGNNVDFLIEYRAIAEGELLNNGTSVTIYSPDGTGYSQYQTKHARFTLDHDHAHQPLARQDHVYLRISRNNGVSNNYTGTVTVLGYELIYNSVAAPTT